MTGGIAAGKSTVAATLAELGACVVDADELVHRITDPGGAAFDAVVAQFGDEILDGSGRIDRTALGRRVFADPQARRALERIVHPEVRAEAHRLFEAAARERGVRVGVFDAALLVETGAYRDFHKLIVVRCSCETQIRRLVQRGASLADARARLAAQAPLERKLALADYVIDTQGTLDETRRQTRIVYDRLLSDFEREFAGAKPRPSPDYS